MLNMSPPILPAYSLRVQLFLSSACGSEDKPVRNFRVVTSPEITVREFCQEASRIHEINYGQPLAIKRVQDDQAFDVTQSEIIGNLFGTSSIVRVVQASKHSGIRDSIPPTSALRFNPLATRKRERYYDNLVPNLEGSWRSNKRQKFFVTDPDSPMPSRESDAVSSPKSSHLSHSQVANTLGKSGKTEKHYSNKSKFQISETPEPVSAGWQNLRAHRTRSVGTQKYSKSDYHEQRDSYKHEIKHDYRHVEPGPIEYESTNEHFRKVNSRESSASSVQSSIFLGQSTAKNVSTRSPKLENLKNQKKSNSNAKSYSFEKAQSKSNFTPGLVDGKLVTKISRGSKVLDISQNDYSLEKVHLEKITSKNPNDKTHIDTVEQENNRAENSVRGTDTSKGTQQVPNKQKKKKKKKKKENTQKSEPQPDSSIGGAQNQQGRKSSQELEANNQNIDSPLANLEKIPSKEKESPENPHLSSKTVLNDRKSSLKVFTLTEKLKDDLSSNSTSFKSTPTNITSSSVIPQSRGRKRSSAINSLQAQNSSHSETSNQEMKPNNENSNHTLSSSNTTGPKNEEKKKDVTTRISTQILPNTPASLQTKTSTPDSSNIKDTKSNIPLQKKSFTPILPPQKAIDISNILIASDDSKTRTTRSKTASAAKNNPTKVTPVVPNQKSRPIKPHNKSKLPNGILNAESLSIKSSSRDQDLNYRNYRESNESSNKKDSLDEVLANTLFETSSNKENIQEASINSQPKSLKEVQNTADFSKTEDDEINREEAQSQNSSDRDSRSPIEFHQNFQLNISHRTPSLSSNSHSDIENSKVTDDNLSSVLNDSGDSSDVDVVHNLDIQEKASDNSPSQFKPMNSINTQPNLEYQELRPNSSHSILKVQVPNSSPALRRNLSSNHATITDASDLSHSGNQGNPNSFTSGPVIVSSSLEVKKPQFKFGASLSEIHRNGGLLSMSQTSQRTNEQNTLAMSLATDTQSESESEDSDASSIS